MSSNGLEKYFYFCFISGAPLLFAIYEREFHMLIAELNCELGFGGKMERVTRSLVKNRDSKDFFIFIFLSIKSKRMINIHRFGQFLK